MKLQVKSLGNGWNNGLKEKENYYGQLKRRTSIIRKVADKEKIHGMCNVWRERRQ